ncbi:MAG: substrate-binding domain-containing protein [Armatimonadota bacterium]
MRRLFLLLLTAAIVAAASGCARKGGQEGAAGADRPHVVFVFKVLGIPYADSLKQGADRAAKELGMKVELLGPATGNDIQGQINLIEDQIARKVDAIVVSPNDADSVRPVLKRAEQAGIAVYTWDSDAPEDVRRFYVAGCDDVQIGVEIAERLAQDLGGKGKVAIMTGGLTAKNLMLHVDGVREGLKKYPGITIVEPLLANNDQKDQAIKGAISMLQKHPDLAGFACVSSPGAPGVAEALIQTGKAGKVKVWGLSLPSEIREHVKNGVVNGAILWNPADLTFATAYLVKQDLEGKKPQDGQEIPGVGKITVKGSQVLIPGIVITKDNIDELDF